MGGCFLLGVIFIVCVEIFLEVIIKVFCLLGIFFCLFWVDIRCEMDK